MTNPNNQIDKQDSVSRMAQFTPEELPYDGWEGCWPGDGSGMDDLADFNANEAYDYMDE
jgi:hypothetical protein